MTTKTVEFDCIEKSCLFCKNEKCTSSAIKRLEMDCAYRIRKKNMSKTVQASQGQKYIPKNEIYTQTVTQQLIGEATDYEIRLLWEAIKSLRARIAYLEKEHEKRLCEISEAIGDIEQ